MGFQDFNVYFNILLCDSYCMICCVIVLNFCKPLWGNDPLRKEGFWITQINKNKSDTSSISGFPNYGEIMVKKLFNLDVGADSASWFPARPQKMAAFLNICWLHSELYSKKSQKPVWGLPWLIAGGRKTTEPTSSPLCQSYHYFLCSNLGMVEMIPSAETLRKIQVEHGVTGSFKDRPLADWLQKHNPKEDDYEKVRSEEERENNYFKKVSN